MPRESRAQRAERIRHENETRWNQFREEYPERLAELIWSFGVEFNDGISSAPLTVQRFQDQEGTWYRFSSRRKQWILPSNLDRAIKKFEQEKEINPALIKNFDLVCQESLFYRELAQEEVRKHKLRQTAIEKLTAEERLLLGIE
jgi:hypothetical protein